MKKMMKKIIISVVTLVIIAGAIIVGIILKKQSDDKKTVGVVPISNINMMWYERDTSLSGIVTTDISQEIYLLSQQSVSDVFVKEGDLVKIGDQLMIYDSTLASLELEMEKLNQDMLDVKLEVAKRDLDTLQKEIPIPDYYARLYENPRVVWVATAVSEGTESETAEQGEVPSESETPSESEVPPEDEKTSESEEPSEDEKPSESEKPSEDEKPSESEKKPEVLNKQAYEELKYDTIAHSGKGTNEEPFVFICTEETIISGTFFNKMGGYSEDGTKRENEKGYCFVLEVRNSKDGYEETRSVAIKGEILNSYEIDYEITWLELRELIEGIIANPEDKENEEFPGADIVDGGDGGYYFPEGYTKDQLNKLIFNKEKDIKQIELDKAQSILKTENMTKALSKLTVTSSINGIVKKVGDPTKGADSDGSAFLIVNSEEGMYVKGSLSELELENIKEGALLQGMSYESGSIFLAEIKEISPYPETSLNYYGGNTNVSYYPFIAYVDNPGELFNNEWVELVLLNEGEQDYSAIYLEAFLIRKEDGQNYVYIEGEDGRLIKQMVVIGKRLGGYAVEIKSGLTLDDNIAFPYGKNVKEGTKTVITDTSSFYY
jgi:hypothetical protein